MTAYSLLLLPGDGIGPEVMAEVERDISFFNKKGRAQFSVSTGLVGGAGIDEHGVPLDSETLEKAKAADAIVSGGGRPKWDKVPTTRARGVSAAAKESICSPTSACHMLPGSRASSLGERGRRPDILLLRSDGGTYFGEPKKCDPENGEKRASTPRYTTHRSSASRG